MTDTMKLEALRSWILVDPGSKEFTNPRASHAYERLGNALRTRIVEGTLLTPADVRAWIARLETAIRHDLRHPGVDPEPGRAMLAFLCAAIDFLDGVEKGAPHDPLR